MTPPLDGWRDTGTTLACFVFTILALCAALGGGLLAVLAVVHLGAR